MKVTLVLAFVGLALGAPQNQQGYDYQAPQQQQQQQQQYANTPAQYNFQWEVNDVNSGNNYGHQEQREGANTQGSYYVLLPDTRLMRVVYYVDETGYHPTITYEGQAVYPQQQQQQQQQGYSQPQPSQPSGSYSTPGNFGK